MDYILCFLIAGMVAATWLLVCNNRTYKHRTSLNDWVFDGTSPWEKRHEIYNRVSYDRHLWRLFFLRSPWPAYGEGIEDYLNR